VADSSVDYEETDASSDFSLEIKRQTSVPIILESTKTDFYSPSPLVVLNNSLS
jgi:hypothetical protein